MPRLLPVLSTVIVLHAAPLAHAAEAAPPRTASTTSLEELLTKAEAAEEQDRLAASRAHASLSSTEARANAARGEELRHGRNLLRRSTDPLQQAEFLFRLAEAYSDKARAVFSQELPPYEAAVDRRLTCTRERAEKDCPPEPELSTRHDAFRSLAIDFYVKLYRDFPRDAHREKILFALAHQLTELATWPSHEVEAESLQREGVALYGELVAMAPESALACDAFVAIGDDAFNHQQFEAARRAFTEARRETCAKTASYATYRLAWTEYNGDNAVRAAELFKDVIVRADRRPPGHVRLKTEALRDIILAFEKAGELRSAIDYFETVVKAGSTSYVDKLATLYFKRGAYDQAIEIYRYLTAKNPHHPKWPVWQMGIVLSYENSGRRSLVLEEVKTLLRHPLPPSEWY